jgi:spore coat polysaccharide biosynthesis predicted glycosyltransferase SpsG
MESNKEIENIFFKVNFNKNLGLGNLLRCIRVAREFPSKKKIFVIENILDSKIKKHLPKNSKIIVNKTKNLSQTESAKKFLAIPELCQKSIVIIDDVKIKEKWQKTIINHIKKLIVIDDTALNKNYCDIYINYKFISNPSYISRIKKLNQKITKIYFGKNYLILDKNLKKNKKKKFFPKNILINFGNSFNFYHAKKLIKKIITIVPKKTNVLVCIGILAKNYKYIINLSKNYNNLKIINKKIFIEKIINKTDIFIGSCGTSLYENAYLNIPSIFFSISPDQKNNIKDIRKIGINFLYKKSEISSKKIIDKFIYLYKNFLKIKGTDSNKKNILNKNGLFRIRKIILLK